MSEAKPSSIGGYRIVRLLGQGGMGTVYEAEAGDGRKVALKRFSLERGNVDFLRRRFLAEADIMRKLASVDFGGNVRFAKIRDAGLDETGRPWFAMDLVLNAEGNPETLEDLRRKGGLDETRMLRWFAELAASLEALHAKGIVHRDFKLENVLIDADGHAVLTDFGVSRVLDERLRRELDLTRTFVTGETSGTRPVMGSYWYLPPEVRAGGEVTETSDWYAFGVAFFRLLTGMWYEPQSRAMDLLAPFPRFWRDQLPQLLDGRRPGLPRRWRRWWIGLLGVAALMVVAGAFWRRQAQPGDEIRMCDCGGYELSATPVTRAQWHRIMGGPKPEAETARWPQTNVSWQEATNFCARLSAQRGRTFRLPTAAEWTAAYRKGATAVAAMEMKTTMETNLRERVCAEGWFGQGVDGIVRHADRFEWYVRRGRNVPRLTDVDPKFPPRTIRPTQDVWLRNSALPPMPVALKRANALGLHDMAGNVFEMVAERIRPETPHSWIDTEYGFCLGEQVPAGAVSSAVDALPLMFGQPFTPGLPGDVPWGSYFPKMPHLGFRVASDAAQ